MTWILGFAWIAFMFIAPVWAVVAVRRQRRELRALRERLEVLETRVARGDEPLSVVPSPAVAPRVPEAMPEPIPLPSLASPRPSPEPDVPTPILPAPATPAPAGGFDSSRAEELIGSVWLQNVGAVLLLLGVFFLILWGYTTGRLGPGVLVGAGVALGIALAWRGDRMARTLPAFGHALIGVGLGTVYLSLYLGHFTLHAIPTGVAFLSLTLVAIGSVAVGLFYRVQTIAALGVLGAFVPQIMAAWIPLKGFSMSAQGLLGYLAAVDAFVFLLAAHAGWSGLGLAALFLSGATWMAQVGRTPWGWGVHLELSILFVALGLSPLPRLVRSEGTVRGIDLAAIALAPFILVAASWPKLASAPREATAAFLAILAILYLAAALWADSRRAERDLWRPLTGAAIVFLTAALERALGPDRTPMAWCVEGTLLVWLGLGERGEWLRRCGIVVSGLGGVWVLSTLVLPGDWDPRRLPVLHPAGIRHLVSILVVLAGAWLLARGRGHLTAAEQRAPEIWSGFGNLMLLVWTGREALQLSFALAGDGGRWAKGAVLAAPGRLPVLAASLLSLVWLAHAAVLVRIGRRGGSGFLRGCGYLAGLLGGMVLVVGINLPDGWSNDQLPALHPAGMISLLGIGLIAAIAAGLAASRAELGANERRMPEAFTMAASLLMLGWIGAEAGHLARWTQGIPGELARHVPGASREAFDRVRVLTPSFTSAGWMIQALALLAVGWVRRSAFLRWAGLGLAGITVLKFLLVDLQTVDVFWRFMTAIVAGAALLGISYAYQRKARGARGTE